MIINYGSFYKSRFMCFDSNNDGNKGDGNGDASGKSPEGFVPVKDVEDLKSDLAKLKQDLEDQRMEMFQPDYIEFLQAKKTPLEKKSEIVKDEDLSKLSNAELFNRAKKEAEAAAKEEINKLRAEFSSKSASDVKKEISDFAATHSDFNIYRPLMHGLSTDPKYKDLTLTQLYDKAKEHAKGFGANDEDKNRSRRSGSEKPGSSSQTVDKGKKGEKVTAEAAAEAGWDAALEAAGGSIPTAI